MGDNLFSGYLGGQYYYNGQNVSPTLVNQLNSQFGTVGNYINNITAANAKTPDPDYSESLWDIFKNGLYDNYKKNPVGFSLGVAGMGAGLWNAYNAYKNQRESLALQKEAYNLQKQFALNAEQRNQEQWDMMKRQRASSAL